MREAAADLNFEEAARLRDEIKRLRATELAVMDDPTAKQPASLPSLWGGAGRDARRGGSRGETQGATGKARKPTLDEMGPGKESAPYHGPRSTLGRPGMRGGFKRKGR
jgi:excinuclease ABC subunit B